MKKTFIEEFVELLTNYTTDGKNPALSIQSEMTKVGSVIQVEASIILHPKSDTNVMLPIEESHEDSKV